MPVPPSEFLSREGESSPRELEGAEPAHHCKKTFKAFLKEGLK